MLRLAVGTLSVIEMDGKIEPQKWKEKRERKFESLYLFLCVSNSGDGNAFEGANN
jgi:hypothetical protein